MTTDITPTKYLDLKGLKCPLPVLRANKALRGLETGAVLEVAATDPASAKDFETYCETAGHLLLMREETNGVYTFRIQKGAER
jgi:tRNA 2-thiouridine synthesizing protein A